MHCIVGRQPHLQTELQARQARMSLQALGKYDAVALASCGGSCECPHRDARSSSTGRVRRCRRKAGASRPINPATGEAARGDVRRHRAGHRSRRRGGDAARSRTGAWSTHRAACSAWRSCIVSPNLIDAARRSAGSARDARHGQTHRRRRRRSTCLARHAIRSVSWRNASN